MDIQFLADTLEKYLETFQYTRWKTVFGYKGRLKDTHFFCGFVIHEDNIEILIRTTQTQQQKAKKTLSHAYQFAPAKLWTQVFITDTKDLAAVQLFIDQAYRHVLTLKDEREKRAEKY